MDNCIFCKIATGAIPSYKIYEDENFYAFLDINPVSEGHALVIPRKHYRWVWDIENIDEYMRVVQKIARNMQKKSGDEMVVSLVLGNEVEHAHIHLIPNSRDFASAVTQAGNKLKKKIDETKVKDLLEKYKVQD